MYMYKRNGIKNICMCVRSKKKLLKKHRRYDSPSELDK